MTNATVKYVNLQLIYEALLTDALHTDLPEAVDRLRFAQDLLEELQENL